MTLAALGYRRDITLCLVKTASCFSPSSSASWAASLNKAKKNNGEKNWMTFRSCTASSRTLRSHFSPARCLQDKCKIYFSCKFHFVFVLTLRVTDSDQTPHGYDEWHKLENCNPAFVWPLASTSDTANVATWSSIMDDFRSIGRRI
jgi:hypothetical protein